MKLRDLLPFAALAFICFAYAQMQSSDEQAAERDRSFFASDPDHEVFGGADRDLADGQRPRGGCE